MWSLGSEDELTEVCALFNLSKEVSRRYVQFGNTFNLLHAAITYTRKHQHGLGVVGVSSEYGRRSMFRYPIFWGLKQVGSLPNPDPSDLALTAVGQDSTEVTSADRLRSKREVQAWAGLDVDDEKQLLVFVGRWTMVSRLSEFVCAH